MMNDKPVVLIVDDDAPARQTAEMMLLRQGYTLLFAANGAEALACLEQAEPDVILLDVMMPEMDGFAVCRAVKTAVSWQHIPIILVTALDSKEDLARGLEAGADDFIHKPVNGLELRARVRSMLRIKQRHDDLQTLIQLRQELSNMIMHDIRNPLATITVYCDLLRDVMPLTENDTLETIIQQVNRLSSFVTDMLMMAKMEHNRLVLMRVPVDVNVLTRTVYELHLPLAQRKGIELVLTLPEVAPVVNLDANLWQRVLDNLLSNALRYAPSGSVVWLETAVSPQGQLCLSVADQGPGIAPEYRETIFDRYQLVASQQRDVKQVGLGLSFCRMVVEAHHGRIFVEPNQPHGAIFKVLL